MNVKEAIKDRRAYRSLDPIDITDEIIEDLANVAQLAPSCMNKQPWRFIFVRDKDHIRVETEGSFFHHPPPTLSGQKTNLFVSLH